MKFLQKQNASYYIIGAFTIFFAVALQIQTTIFQTDTYEGLRINLADFGLPAVGLYILFSLVRGKTNWPRWQPPFHYAWPVLLTAVIGFGILHGYYLTGEWLDWALLNKGVGWLILMTYLLCGGWIATNYSTLNMVFLKVFLAAFFVISSVLVICLFIDDKSLVFLYPSTRSYFSGLMYNRNAYAFLLLAVYVFVTIFALKVPRSLPLFVLSGFWFLLPILLFFNGSRALWLCFFLLLPFVVALDWKKFMCVLCPVFLLGTFCVVIFSSPIQKKNISYPLRNLGWLQTYVSKSDVNIHKEIYGTGDGYRIDIITESIEAWKEHPVFGAGIGYTKRTRVEERGHLINVIDNSMLWVLTEMGVLALAVFLSAYTVILLALKNKFLYLSAEWEEQSGILALSCFTMVLVFGVFSLFHEILYMRFFWFLLGLGLAVPNAHSQKNERDY